MPSRDHHWPILAVFFDKAPVSPTTLCAVVIEQASELFAEEVLARIDAEYPQAGIGVKLTRLYTRTITPPPVP